MEVLAEANTCFISEATARRVVGYFDLAAIGEFRVKGVAEPLEHLVHLGARPAAPANTRDGAHAAADGA